jgi:ArsR family transcriptional regulator, arsenate/arsenite/antimonite-responsive transcriptional repressor
VLEEARNDFLQVVEKHRFLVVSVHASINALLLPIFSRHTDDYDAGIVLAYLLGCGASVHSWHAEVHQNQVVLVLLDESEGFFCGRGAIRLKAEPVKLSAQHLSQCIVIINDENHFSPTSGHDFTASERKRQQIKVWAKHLTANQYFDSIGNMKTNDAVKALGALAQESRLDVFRLLVRKGANGMAAGELSDHFAMPAATMSFHLKELHAAGLVVSRRESRSIIYSANYAHMQDLLSFLMENCCADNGGK